MLEIDVVLERIRQPIDLNKLEQQLAEHPENVFSLVSSLSELRKSRDLAQAEADARHIRVIEYHRKDFEQNGKKTSEALLAQKADNDLDYLKKLAKYKSICRDVDYLQDLLRLCYSREASFRQLSSLYAQEYWGLQSGSSAR